ncbi:MAG: TerC family protein, partial [Chloroflexia bacterium]|nr:TerC family protein [Chloroflexia bacterium]
MIMMTMIATASVLPAAYQHRVLFWGIVGALIMRALLIAFAGILLSTPHWMIYVFGAFLILTAIKIFRSAHAAPSLES